MEKKNEEELLNENSHTGESHETQEIKVKNLHFPLTDVPQNGDSSSSSSPAPVEADWDLDSIRLNQNFDALIGAQQVVTVVKVRKPNGQEWFRVHPDETWRHPTIILQLKAEGEDYLIGPNLLAEVWDEIQPVMLFSAINRQGEFFIWPVRLPKEDGRTDSFMESDMVAAKEAENKWTRRKWLPENRAHKIMVASGLTDEPKWPEISFQELVRKAFKEKYIHDLDHPLPGLLIDPG